MFPQAPVSSLTRHVERCEAQVSILELLDREADGGHHVALLVVLLVLEVVQDGGLSAAIQSDHQNVRLALSQAEQVQHFGQEGHRLACSRLTLKSGSV